MDNHKEIILEYNTSVPNKLKVIIERAVKITFDGCDIKWLSDKRLMITNYKLRKIHVNT